MEIRALRPDDAAAFQALRLQGLLECPTAFASSHAEEVGTALTTVAERLTASDERGFLCIDGVLHDELHMVHVF